MDRCARLRLCCLMVVYVFAGVLFKYGYTSTPTCTPARAAILTGQKPWNHGLLGAGSIAKKYPFEACVCACAFAWRVCVVGLFACAPY